MGGGWWGMRGCGEVELVGVWGIGRKKANG